jgi:hypothetical protein
MSLGDLGGNFFMRLIPETNEVASGLAIRVIDALAVFEHVGALIARVPLAIGAAVAGAAEIAAAATAQAMRVNPL